MRRNRRGPAWMLLTLSWALCSLPVSSAPGAEADVRRDAVVRAVEIAMPAVVNIATEEVVEVRDPLQGLFREFFGPYYRRRAPNTQYSLGSGVLVDEEGYIVTNHHVVARARRVWVRLHDGREFEAEKVAGSADWDVALLRIRGEGEERFPAIRFAADDDLLLGETVLALGNPFGLGGSVSRGILSSKSRRPPREGESMDVYDWLQTDAAINPGNSGGPLVNLKGELIGINVAIYREAEGIGFALPVRRVVEAVTALYSAEAIGQVWFGASVRPGRKGLRIEAVAEASPAERAGLTVGDRVTGIDGEAVPGYFGFCRHLAETGPGGRIELELDREGATRKVTVTLVALESFFNEELIRRRTGAVLQVLTPALARALGLGRLRGLLVGDVDPDSAAHLAGLSRGMVVTRMEGEVVRDLVTAARKLHAMPAGKSLQLDVVISRTRGRLLLVEEAVLTLKLP